MTSSSAEAKSFLKFLVGLGIFLVIVVAAGAVLIRWNAHREYAAEDERAYSVGANVSVLRIEADDNTSTKGGADVTFTYTFRHRRYRATQGVELYNWQTLHPSDLNGGVCLDPDHPAKHILVDIRRPLYPQEICGKRHIDGDVETAKQVSR